MHDDQYDANHGNAFGPGEAGHEAQLREYNAAFATFFSRLAPDGINKQNTLFLVTVDEGGTRPGPDDPTVRTLERDTHCGWDWWSHGERALPWSIRVDERDYQDLAAVYKELDAPFGEFGLSSSTLTRPRSPAAARRTTPPTRTRPRSSRRARTSAPRSYRRSRR